MADSVEATSRSLQVKDKTNLSLMVEEIINQQIRDQQFDNTDITFRDIDLIKEIFLRKLLNIYHVRIEYPS
jgi:membrane-associated HD superfamily phosphohydrolase